MQCFGIKTERDSRLLFQLPGFPVSRVTENEGPSLGTWKLRAAKNWRIADSPTTEDILRVHSALPSYDEAA